MNWTCPYCDRDQVITNNRTVSASKIYQKDDALSILGPLAEQTVAITCANEACKELTLQYEIYEFARWDLNHNLILGKRMYSWNLLPASTAKPQPSYIPAAITDDYVEACKIRDLSPKASATLSRRCLQGMIRDFCKISKNRLIEEIDELRKQVSAGTAPQGVLADSVDAIDAVRGIGNIGAHMEKDINVIVDIEPSEANILIGLIEMLFREWYVQKHQREDRLKALAKLAGVKQIERKTAAVKQLPAPDAK
jgi:hypothetical protein